MKFDKNILAFICLNTSGGNIYPPQDVAKEITKNEVYKNWENYLGNDYENHKKIGFYLHTPFCEAKCVFCSCGSKKILGGNTLDSYLEKIEKELEFYHKLFKNVEFNHAYFGGGTPSIYNEKQLEFLLKTIREKYNFKENAQFNFEISPHTITEEKIKILKKYGVSRITIGIQTMTKRSLDFNNRFQTWKKLIKTFKWIRKHNIKHINVDLMPGIPGEDLKSFLINLKKIINLGPDMIHLYPFRPTEETLFTKNGYEYSKLDIKNRDLMYELGIKLIEKNGYYGVENDSWGKIDEARNEQEVDKIVNNCSILGFGYPTRSYIHKNMMYFTGYNMYSEEEPVYMGIEIKKQDYMIRYIISHFRSGFSLTNFFDKFQINFIEFFAKEIKFLEENNIAFIENGFLKTNIKSVFEKLLYSKIFYSEGNINFLLEKFNYNKNINYIEKFENTLSGAYK